MPYLKLTITDTMGFWEDFLGDYIPNPNHGKTFTDWYRIPDDWVRDGNLIPEKREALLRHLYGESWRLGNGDGSKYVILKIDEQVFTNDEVTARPWLAGREKCYSVGAAGVTDIDTDKF